MEALESAGVEFRESVVFFLKKPLSVWMLLNPNQRSWCFEIYSQAALDSAGVEFSDSVVILEEATLSVNAPKTYSCNFKIFE